MIGLALVAVFAMSAVAAASALAVNGPYYKVAGARLGSGSTHPVKVKASVEYKLKGTIFGVTVTTKCKSLTLNPGAVIVGSAVGTAGSSKEILEYGECSVENNGSSCKVEKSEVKTKEVTNTLAYSSSAKTGKLLTAFVPVSPNVFVTIKYEGTCNTKEVTVEGSAVAEDLNGKGEVISVGSHETEEATGQLKNNPENGVKYWTESGSTLTPHEANLSFATFGSATIEGKSTVELGEGTLWGVFTT
jgi:hypothetical protein